MKADGNNPFIQYGALDVISIYGRRAGEADLSSIVREAAIRLVAGSIRLTMGIGLPGVKVVKEF